MEFHFYYDLRFWLFCCVTIVSYRLFAARKILGRLSLIVGSALMLLALPRFSVYSLAFVVGLSLLVFLTGRALSFSTPIVGHSKRVVLAVGCIALVVMQLGFFKYKAVQDVIKSALAIRVLPTARVIFVLGISYLSFKMIHFVVECYKGTISSPTYLDFMSFVLYFPAFISGPLSRYDVFREQLAASSEAGFRADLRGGGLRILNGLFKKIVVAAILYPHTFMSPEFELVGMPAWRALITLYLSTLYFYFDFSAYSDLAIGTSRAIGLELPENFDRPFFKSNIQKLWASWHISLTQWLRDYVYWPLARKLRSRDFFAARPILLSSVCTIVTFLVCGMWHGDTIAFVGWGLYHGVGLSVLSIYQKQKRRVRNERLRRYYASGLSRAVGVFLTFNFFALGMVVFFFDSIPIAAIRTWF